MIAVGEGTKDEKMILKADDVVLYGKYAGTEIENEGTKYLMMRRAMCSPSSPIKEVVRDATSCKIVFIK